MKYNKKIAVITGITVFVIIGIAASNPPEEKYKNLKVLPKKIPKKANIFLNLFFITPLLKKFFRPPLLNIATNKRMKTAAPTTHTQGCPQKLLFLFVFTFTSICLSWARLIIPITKNEKNRIIL